MAIAICIAVLIAVTAVMTFARPPVPGVVPAGPEELGYLFNSVAFGVAGALVARHQHTNRAWMGLSAAGAASSRFGFGVQYTGHAVLIRPDALPGAPDCGAAGAG